MSKDKLILQTPKGMHDILPDDYYYYQNIMDKAEEIASYYGFQPIQIPILEYTELFTTGTGATTDIVQRQMFSLKTSGDDQLTLRPEGTPNVMRAYIEHGMHTLPQPVMLWYKGSFFRHERPQKGRFREFQQFGLEILGEQKPIAETVIIHVFKLLLEELGLGPIIVHINSIGDKECRGTYRRELLNYYKKRLNGMCKDCKTRFKENPLRLLDCKEPACIEAKKEAPQAIDSLCPDCKQHFKEVLESLDSNNISYFLDNTLVRGLDYYSRTVFEIFEDRKPAEGETLSALGGGGRYDYLGKILGKREVPAAGGGLGVDRIVQLMKDKNILAKHKRAPKVFLIQLGSAAKFKSFEITEMFRKAKLPISQSVGKDSIRSQLTLAAKLNVKYALILGQKEAVDNTIIVRDMETGNQETVPMKDVVEIIRKK